MAPATKYGGKMVVCHPGMTEVAKSKLTIVCTERTSGVASPARTRDNDSCRCQCLAAPVHPNARKVYSLFLKPFALSLTVAKSGTSPVYQKRSDTVKYVEIANKSQSSGELKLGHKGPLVLGYGKKKKVTQTRPTCIAGNKAAQITAKMVMASAARFTPVLHFCRNNKRIAEINVPACPIPIHQTKFVMSHPHPIVLLSLHVPMPTQMVIRIQMTPKVNALSATMKAIVQAALGALSVGDTRSSVI